MAKPVLEVTLDDKVDADIKNDSDSNSSFVSDPTAQRLGELPLEMIVQDEHSDEQTNEVIQLFQVPFPSPCYEDSNNTIHNDPKTQYN